MKPSISELFELNNDPDPILISSSFNVRIKSVVLPGMFELSTINVSSIWYPDPEVVTSIPVIPDESISSATNVILQFELALGISLARIVNISPT